MKKIQAWLKQVSGKVQSEKNKAVKETKASSSQENKTTADKESQNYFQLASSWADDYHTIIVASRNRYRVALLSVIGLCAVLVVAVISLSNTHEYIPLIVHHYDSGAVSVEQANQHYVPESQAEIESELVRYIVNRESYDPTSFTEQYQLVTLMSDNTVAREYHQAQNSDDQSSLIATLGNRLVRTVKIQSVNFLDKESLNNEEKHHTNHKNLAEINFVVTDRDVKSGKEINTPYVAILSWGHAGIPNDPETRWMNWNGFTITNYQRNQRTL